MSIPILNCRNGMKKMYLFGMIFLMTLSVCEANAGIKHYTDENGMRNFTYAPHASTHKGDPRLSPKANKAIMALKDFNDCLSKKGKRSQLYKTLIIETGKWLESAEARWSEPAAREIREALLDYENYESLLFRKINGFEEGQEGRIDHDGVLWLQFIEEYPTALDGVPPNLNAMMNFVLQQAVAHTNQALEYMIDIAQVLKGRQ